MGGATSSLMTTPIPASAARAASQHLSWLGVVLGLTLTSGSPAQQFRALAAVPGQTPRDANLVDVDRDGNLDLLCTGLDAATLARGDGRGGFAAPSAISPSFVDRNVVADFDGDADVDVLCISRAGDVLLRNRGDGTFVVDTRTPFPTGDRTDAVAVDIDGDGDEDLVRTDFLGGTITAWLNDGTGFFTAAPDRLRVPSAGWWSIVAGDVDGDGDHDLLAAGGLPFPPMVAVFVNDGRGRFTTVALPDLPASEPRVFLADLDGDGDRDIVLSDDIVTALYFNDGRGAFTRDPQTTAGQLLVFDLDDDGDADLVAGEWAQINDGRGRFGAVDASRGLGLAGLIAAAAAVGDIDADGDLDVVARAASGSALHVRANRHRGSRVTVEPRLGARVEFALEAQPGYAQTFQVLLPLLGLGVAAIEVPPIGRVGIDPATLTQIGLLYLAGPGGEARVGVAVPDDPALLGQLVAVQGLVLEPLNGARLTNTSVARVQ